METLQAQCKAFEQNLVDVNESLQKEQDEHGIVWYASVVIAIIIKCEMYVRLDKLKEEFINERHSLSELKSKYNAYKETNKALEEQIRDLQVI